MNATQSVGIFKQYADRVAKLRVPAGFLLVVTFGALSRPDARSLRAGTPAALLGLFLRAWAAGHLDKNARLAQSGPYAHVRNPLYLGTSLVATGLVIASRRRLLAAIFGGVFVLIYLPVIELEEQHLRALFPEFADYANRVPALLPRMRADSKQRFQPRQYIRNREYQAALGLLAGVGFLVAKLFWTKRK